MELFSTLPSSHITAHQLVSVGSGEAVRVWLPRLSAIMSHLKKTGVQHARDVCLRVLGETTLKAEVYKINTCTVDSQSTMPLVESFTNSNGI